MEPTKQKNKNPFIIILGNKRWQFITIPIFCILCGALAISIIIFFFIFLKTFSVSDAFSTVGTFFKSILQGSGLLPKENYAAHKSILTDFMKTLDAMTPMLFAALSVAVALKAGLFNIGVSGQMLFSGFIASITIGYSDLSSAIAWPAVLIVGILCGALIGGIIGALKYFFNINEVVSSIMLNYILQYIISFFINTFFVDPVSRESRAVSKASRLTLSNVQIGDLKMDIPLCFLLAIIVAVALQFFFSKTKQGYELKAVGQNPIAAKYAGIKVGYNLIFAMLLSGALAGLAGVSYYMGQFNSIKTGTLTSVGFDSIAVSLLGNSHPIGTIFSSFLITSISNTSAYMNSSTSLRPEISSLFIGLILLFSACSIYIRTKVNKKESALTPSTKSYKKDTSPTKPIKKEDAK